MEKTSFKHIALLMLLACALLPTFASVVSEENKRKAEYYFVESQRAKTQERYDEAVELIRYARALDPENAGIAYTYGRLLLALLESPDVELSLELMRMQYKENPDNFTTSSQFAMTCQYGGAIDEAISVWQDVVRRFPKQESCQYALVDCYLRAGKYREALAFCDTMEITQGKNSEITMRKFAALYPLRDTVSIIKEARALLLTAPKNVTYNLGLAQVYQSFGVRDSALYYINKAEEADPETGQVIMVRAEYYRELGDVERYDSCMYKALENENIDVEEKLNILTQYSTQLLEANDSTNRSENLFDALITLHPHESKIHDMYSRILATKKDYSHAAEQLEYMLDIDPTNSDGWQRLMFVCLLNRDFEKATVAGDKALYYNPDNAELYRYIGPAYFQMKKYEKSLEVYHQALEKLDSTDTQLMSEIYGGMGDAHFEMKDTVQAFADYEKALELDPDNISVMNNYAYFLSLSDKDLDKAERMSARVVKENPENWTYIDTYAWIFYKKGDYAVALLYMEQAMSKAEAQGDVSYDMYEHYGEILKANGKEAEGEVQLKKAEELKKEEQK